MWHISVMLSEWQPLTSIHHTLCLVYILFLSAGYNARRFLVQSSRSERFQVLRSSFVGSRSARRQQCSWVLPLAGFMSYCHARTEERYNMRHLINQVSYNNHLSQQEAHLLQWDALSVGLLPSISVQVFDLVLSIYAKSGRDDLFSVRCICVTHETRVSRGLIFIKICT